MTLEFAGVAALLAVLPAGCAREGKTVAGATTPEALAEAFVRAADSGDAEALGRLFPPVTLVQRSLECAGDEAASELGDERVKVSASVQRGRAAGARLAWRGAEDVGSTRMEAGEQRMGCTARVPVEVHKLRVHFQVTLAGQARDEKQELRVVRFGTSAWFLQGM